MADTQTTDRVRWWGFQQRMKSCGVVGGDGVYALAGAQNKIIIQDCQFGDGDNAVIIQGNLMPSFGGGDIKQVGQLGHGDHRAFTHSRQGKLGKILVSFGNCRRQVVQGPTVEVMADQDGPVARKKGPHVSVGSHLKEAFGGGSGQTVEIHFFPGETVVVGNAPSGCYPNQSPAILGDAFDVGAGQSVRFQNGFHVEELGIGQGGHGAHQNQQHCPKQGVDMRRPHDGRNSQGRREQVSYCCLLA